MRDHCTACQLCVSACPNNILIPSKKLETFMQPEMTFEEGYCRPECVECSLVCPSGAISLVDRDPGYSDSLKTPTIDKELCIGCGACENLCPARPFSAIYVEGNVRHHAV